MTAIAVYDLGGQVHPGARRRGLGRAHPAREHRVAPTSVRPARKPARRSRFARTPRSPRSGNRALLEAHGFEPIRWFFLMRRRDLDDIPDAPLPDGLEIRPVTPDQHRAIFDAEVEAFRDHWSAVEKTDEDLETHARRERNSTRTCGSWPGTATRSPASSRTGSGPRRTPRSASTVAGSSTSACAGRGGVAAWPGRSPRNRCAASPRPG